MSWSACLRILGTVSSQSGLSFSLLQTQRPLGASLTTQAPQAQTHSTLSAWPAQDITSLGVGVGVVQAAGRASGLNLECASGFAALYPVGENGWPRCCWVSGVQMAGFSGGLEVVRAFLVHRLYSLQPESQRLWAGGESAVSVSKWAAGGRGGAGWGHRRYCSHQAQHYPLGISSLWPEMTWPGQRGCQEDAAAGRERGGWTNRWQLEPPSFRSIASQSLPGVTRMLQLSTHVPIVGVGPGGQILISPVTSSQALAEHSVLENCSL